MARSRNGYITLLLAFGLVTTACGGGTPGASDPPPTSEPSTEPMGGSDEAGRPLIVTIRTDGRLQFFRRDGTRMWNLEGPDGFRAAYMPRWSPDHSKVAVVGEVSGQREVGVYEVDSRDFRRYSLGSGLADVADVAWSPDGEHLAVLLTAPSDDGEIDLITDSLDDDSVQVLFAGTGLSSLSWGAPDNLLFLADDEAGIPQTWLMQGRDAEPVAVGPRDVRAARLHPSGQKILFFPVPPIIDTCVLVTDLAGVELATVGRPPSCEQKFISHSFWGTWMDDQIATIDTDDQGSNPVMRLYDLGGQMTEIPLEVGAEIATGSGFDT